jgi:hypothetical protein
MISKIKKLVKAIVLKPVKVLIEPQEPKVVQKPYQTVPAPVVTPNDSWFGEAPKTEKVIEYVKKKNEELYQKLAEEPQSKEVDNIHEVMYNKSTAKGNTTVQLDPQPQGGSENVWQSGAGPHF